MLEDIPVDRSVDHAVKGVGLIKGQGLDIIGKGTQFLEDLKPGMTVEADGNESAVLEVISNTLAKGTYNLPTTFMDYRIQPKLDNSKMFHKVLKHLSNKKPLFICPEGRSHETPGTIKFKSGIGRIILECMKANIPINIYCIGVNYTYPDYLRNNVTISISPLLTFPQSLLEQDERDAVKTIVSHLYTELNKNVIPLQNYDEVKLAHYIYSEQHGTINKNQRIQKIQKICQKIDTLRAKSPEQLAELIESFCRFRDVIQNREISKYFTSKPGFIEMLFCIIFSILILALVKVT